MIYALYIEQKITIFALYTKHKYKNQINNLTMENELQVIGTKEVEERIIELRGQKILLDRDVAELYKTETRDINKAVRNNPEKFPSGYFFTLKPSEKQYVVENFHRMENLKKSTVEPKAFTEKGLYMLATVLKSPRATATTLAIIESFAHLRELSRNLNILSTETDEGKQKTLTQRSSELLHELLSVEEKGDTTETESSIELNLYALKMKRMVKKTKKG